MEGVTLLESGTNRIHFAFLKRYEACKSALQADELIIETISEIKSSLQTKTILSTISQSDQLLLLLHCNDLYPCSLLHERSRPSIQVALVPALQLAATATKSRDLLISYNILGRLFADQNAEEQRQTSLLMLNTLRQHLEVDDTAHVAHDAKRRRTKVTLALRSIINGLPSGSDIFPALYGPISLLCDNADEGIQSLALGALAKVFSYIEYDEGLARATWERSRVILERNAKARTLFGGTALPKALLRAARQAHQYQIISNGKYVEICFRMANEKHSPYVSMLALQSVVDIAREASMDLALVEEIRSIATRVCLDSPDDYALLLSLFQLIGRLAPEGWQRSRFEGLPAVWGLIREHLSAKNANRKVLALEALAAFLPFRWFDVDNIAGIQLSEMEMGLVMDMLGDRDDNVRLQALSLVWRIDTELLDGHCQQLVEACASQDDSLPGKGRFIHRALEATSVRYLRAESILSAKTFACDICSILSGDAREQMLNQEVIEYIMTRIRQGNTSSARQVLLCILRDVADSQIKPTAMITLLYATLACELECFGEEGKEVLEKICCCSLSSSNAATLEATLLAAIKIGSNVEAIDANSIALVKELQGHNSAVIKQRAKQFEACSHNLGSREAIASGSLLDVMDQIDRTYISRPTSVQIPAEDIASDARGTRPLRYDAYHSQTQTSSPSVSLAGNAPFEALPKPSIKIDDRSRKQRQNFENQLHREMQQSIARLTLGAEDIEDD